MLSDNDILETMDLGGLSDDQKTQALDNILRTLHLRVGQRVIELLDEEQLTEFEELLLAQDQMKIEGWLKENIEHYDQLVTEELFKIENQADETYTQIA
jgi:hypothetical protein